MLKISRFPLNSYKSVKDFYPKFSTNFKAATSNMHNQLQIMSNKDYFIRLIGEKLVKLSVPVLLLIGAYKYKDELAAISASMPTKKTGSDIKYLKIQKLNDKLESFSDSFKEAELGKFQAFMRKRERKLITQSLNQNEINLPRNVCEEIEGYYSKVIQEKDLLYIEKEKLFSALRLLALQYPNPEDAVDEFNLAALVDIPSNISPSGGVNSNLKGKSHIPLKSKPSNQESKPSDLTKPKSEVSIGLRKKLEVIKKLEDIVQQIIDLDDEFYAKIGLCIESEVRKYNLQEPQIMETKQRILSSMLSNSMPKIFKRHGDILASQVADLKEEITAVVSNAKPERGDCVVLIMNSGGGTVNGYGLAAAQLERIKLAGLNLVVCVDEVAASGGYMMASVADKIYASPMAALGSIGVVATMPNIHERLSREGVEVDEITAGKYKRTLTYYKKSSKSDRDKVKSDIEDILVLFKNHIKKFRPSLNVDKVATGEVWFGPDALSKGLCDELCTSDDVLMRMRKDNCEIFSVKYKEPKDPENPFEYLSEVSERVLSKLFRLSAGNPVEAMLFDNKFNNKIFYQDTNLFPMVFDQSQNKKC